MPQCEHRNPCGSYPFCLGGLTGVNCNIPVCSKCLNGICKISAGSCSSSCVCYSGWSGQSCDTRITNGFGDVHFETFDHKFYDFQGVGEFWYCLDKKNDFGIQIRSYVKYLYDSVSWIGGIAVKLENNTFTQVLNDSSPIVRMNGEVIKISSEYLNISLSDNILISFEYKDDKLTTTIDVKEEFSITIRYFMRIFQMEISLKNLLINTTGLCGTNDGNQANDFIGSNGYLFDDEWRFGNSWKINMTRPLNNSSWNWDCSNFYHSDLMDDRFNEAFLTLPPIGKNKLSFFSNETLQNALMVCRRNYLKNTLLDMCVLDVAAGGLAFAEDESYKVEQCPYRCNGKGKCVGNDECECIEGWSGKNCEIGSCTSTCGDNGKCILGFCECDDGWDGDKCNERALCNQLSNCTNENQGICRKHNECMCHDGFDGFDCSKIADCKYVHSCSGNLMKNLI